MSNRLANRLYDTTINNMSVTNHSLVVLLLAQRVVGLDVLLEGDDKLLLLVLLLLEQALILMQRLDPMVETLCTFVKDLVPVK